jgi:hypothetical protein
MYKYTIGVAYWQSPVSSMTPFETWTVVARTDGEACSKVAQQRAGGIDHLQTLMIVSKEKVK